MTKCKNCRTTLSSKVIFKSYWKGYKKFNCSNCPAEYEFTLQDRFIGGLVIGISTFITGLIVYSFELDIIWKLMFGLLSMTVFSLALSALSISFLKFQIDKK
jgi:CXXC-20-CXXC protein